MVETDIRMVIGSSTSEFVYIILPNTNEGEKPVNLLKYKKLLVNQLLAEADTSKPLDHKQHKIAQPNIPVNSNQCLT